MRCNRGYIHEIRGYHGSRVKMPSVSHFSPHLQFCFFSRGTPCSSAPLCRESAIVRVGGPSHDNSLNPWKISVSFRFSPASLGFKFDAPVAKNPVNSAISCHVSRQKMPEFANYLPRTNLGFGVSNLPAEPISR